jgi:hypothetical protein
MTFFGLAAPRPIAAVAACSVLLVISATSAAAAPGTDGQGYVDSTARCNPPATAVLFGGTESSRVAICKTGGGQYEYRGVRLRDGAKLLLPATTSGNGFVAANGEMSYLVTAKSLVISLGDKVIRDEAMVDVHQPGTPPAPETSTTPLPPPLPAEAGGAR